MANLKLALLIGGGASTVIGGAVGAYYLAQEKTIEDSLKREGFEFAKTKDQFEVSFKELKNEDAFINEIKALTDSIKKESSLEDGGKALNKWCDSKVKSTLGQENTKELTEKIKKYCVALPITARDKLIKANYKAVTQWDAKFEKIEGDTDGAILSDLTKIKNTIKKLTEQKADALLALEQWCKENEKTKLNANDSDAIYKKVEVRCFNK